MLNLEQSKHVTEKIQSEMQGERDTIEKYLDFFKVNIDAKERKSTSKSKPSFINLNNSKSGRNSKKTLDSLVLSEIQNWDQSQHIGMANSEKTSL